MTPPAFFEAVKAAAASTWETLEAKPELAGPWHRLFQQVQSPRHVLSELLQNADDAGATWASASCEEGVFRFSHNGRDFSEQEFGSICRFGYSNKRALHTIGFRGVGFKSVFSLGDEVRVSTPSLRILFRRERFTEPIWDDGRAEPGGLTRVEVRLRDEGARKQLASNLEEWLASPASLLFFRSIRSLRIGDSELEWLSVGPGPVPDSQWLTLAEGSAERFLLIRSSPEPFPEEALAEIESERILGEGEHLDLPPCSVDLLLGSEHRLFVVLPSGVKTNLPFAVNAPFIQDTARLKVKDPDMSPTNKWLLGRAGRLAAEAMLAWLGNSADDRENAYALMPDVNRDDPSLEGSCAAEVELAFDDAIEGRPFVLVEGDRLVESGKAVSLPDGLMGIWSLSETRRLFSPNGGDIASRRLSAADKTKLAHWNAIKVVVRSTIIEQLRNARPRKPQSWRELLHLWSYLADDIPAYHWHGDIKDVSIAPVQGGNDLAPANTVVRLGEKRLLTSDSDWTFLAEHLQVLNPNWGRFLAEQRKLAQERGDEDLSSDVERAYRLMSHLQLEEASDASSVMRRVASAFFTQGSLTISGCVKLAQIAARLGAQVGSEFKFVCRDSRVRASSFGLIADELGQVQDIVPETWAEQHLLHHAYWTEWTSCSKEEWSDWVASGRSCLLTAPPLEVKEQDYWSRRSLDVELKRRRFEGGYEPHFKTEHFKVRDADFDSALWTHWRNAAEQGETIWPEVLALVLRQRPSFWEKALEARVVHVATTGNTRQIAGDGIPSSWILKLRELPCILDSRGQPRRPFELLRRTPQTEALLEVEPFVPGAVDTEGNRSLFDALGVSHVPSGPEQVLIRIEALSQADVPPLDELDKWYRKLDSLVLSCSTAQSNAVREAFESQALIYSAEHGWLKSGEIFLETSEDDMPDAPVVRPNVRDLGLWRRVGVADRPNLAVVLAWLKTLPSGEALSSEVVKRVKASLARFPDSIWNGTGHWLNLASQWTPTESLRYSLSLRSLTKSQDLFPGVRAATADFQMLSHEQQDRQPFSSLPYLASRIDERIDTESVRHFEHREKPWMTALGETLSRILLPSEEERQRVKHVGLRLARTKWLQGTGLQTTPYIDGTPAGPPRRVSVVWRESSLYVEDAPMAALAGPVSKELARQIDSASIADGIKFAFERDDSFIESFFGQEFKLAEPSLLEETESAEPSLAEETKREAEPISEAAAESRHSIEANDSVGGTEPEQPAPTEDRHRQEREARNRPEGVQRHQRPSIIELFAARDGFSRNGDGGFKAEDGRRLIQSQGSFSWEIRDPEGNLIRALLPQEHCLEKEPILIDSEVWVQLNSASSTHALLLLAPDSTPSLVTGEAVARELEEGRIALYPAKYRLSRTS